METILLVEDEAPVRRLLARSLTRAGYSVHEAADGHAALALFDAHGDSIDMVLTDMLMPGMGGAELSRHLRARRPGVKLLCVSGYPGTLDDDFVIDFLAKPFTREDLLTKVREVLDK